LFKAPDNPDRHAVPFNSGLTITGNSNLPILHHCETHCPPQKQSTAEKQTARRFTSPRQITAATNAARVFGELPKLWRPSGILLNN